MITEKLYWNRFQKNSQLMNDRLLTANQNPFCFKDRSQAQSYVLV